MGQVQFCKGTAAYYIPLVELIQFEDEIDAVRLGINNNINESDWQFIRKTSLWERNDDQDLGGFPSI
jgi:hypothetical protein